MRTDHQSRVNWQHFLHLYNPSKAPHALESTKQAAATDSEEWASPSNRVTVNNSTISSPAAAPKSAGNTFRTDDLPDMDKQYRDKMKKCWQKLLKECQKIDYNRIGAVSKNDFLYAVSSSGLEKVSVCTIYVNCIYDKL